MFSACGTDNAEEPSPSATPGETQQNGEDNNNENNKEEQDSNGSLPEGAEAFLLPEAVRTAASDAKNNASSMAQRAVSSQGNTRRLQEVFLRMAQKEEVTVAYLGGSITEGYMVNSTQNYAYKTTNWLKKVFENDNIKHVNAGLSGTSSTIGLLRVQQDVLDKKPDLVFVEFAVNDANDATSKMMYESLISRIINSETAPAVVLIFTVLENGYTCEEHMSRVGEAHRLPMISVNAALSPELESKNIEWSDYGQDEAHPTKQGHIWISEFIQYFFADIITKNALDEEMDYTACKEFGAPYAGMNFYNTKNLYIPDTGGFVETDSDIQHFPNDWIWGKKEGGSLEFTMTGKNLILLYKEVNNKNMAAVDIYVDGNKKAQVNANSPDGWNNPETYIVFNDVEEGEHTVKITITEDTIDKNFHILGFGTTGTINSKERVKEEDMTYQDRAIQNIGNTFALQELIKRAEAGEELTIGFIGGSITQGVGASNSNKCYAKLVYDWWCDTFPQATFHYVNAGIGGTTSQFGCARVQPDLLDSKPDFVVVEFSVNDDATSFFAETYESLVRMILLANPDAAVMVLNMVQYNSGANAQMIHNEVAKHYDLPAVSMKDSIYREIILKHLEATDVTVDMIHPNDTGHAYGAEIVTYFLGKVKDGTYHSDKAATLAEPIRDLKSMTSVRHDNRNSEPELKGFVKDTTEQRVITDTFRNGYTAEKEGDSIIFNNIYGSRISLQYRQVYQPKAPKAIAVVDGNEEAAVSLDGNYPNDWGNLLYMHNIADNLDPTVPHTVEIRITEEGDSDFYLVSVITVGESLKEE